MAAMPIIVGQAYLFTDIVLFEYTYAMYAKTNDLHHLRSYLNIMYITGFFVCVRGFVWFCSGFFLLNSK